MRPEDRLSQQIADYLNYQYPTVIYHFDTGSGGRTTIGMAMRNKRLNTKRGFPDLILCEPRGTFHGLFIELKKEGFNPYKRNGELKSDYHLKEQQNIISELLLRGYWAQFSCGFDETIKVINNYLTIKL